MHMWLNRGIGFNTQRIGLDGQTTVTKSLNKPLTECQYCYMFNLHSILREGQACLSCAVAEDGLWTTPLLSS